MFDLILWDFKSYKNNNKTCRNLSLEKYNILKYTY